MSSDKEQVEKPKAKMRPAERDPDGNCIDMRCTRMGGNWSEGDWGKCVGWHCPHCDTPCSSHGHNCPIRPEGDGLPSVQGGPFPTTEAPNA